MINLHHLSLSRGKKVLLENVSLSIHPKQKIGLVGRNGCGKSSLIKLLTNQISPDQGEYHIQQKLEISHLSQDLPDSEDCALNYVLSGDENYWQLIQKLEKAERQQDVDEVVRCHHEMEETDAYSKPAKAASILAGLGFDDKAQQKAVNQFSGGWQVRINLARCLMKPAELLLLDEPTNHLDLEAIYWLERYLNQSQATIIMVAHDRDFLDNCSTHIIHIENKEATLYKGNYSQFEKERALKLSLQQAVYEKQQKKLQHMMSFVERFKAKASKAKQARSRVKAIERMEFVAQAQLDSPFSFEFYPCDRASRPLIRCDNLFAGYTESQPVLKDVNFQINPGDRFALLGPNGQGKSTLIKTLTGKLPVLSGSLYQCKQLKIAYFAQDILQELDCNQSPLEMIQQLSSSASEQVIRNFLGGFNFHSEAATQPCHHFSGGEKARLALAKLVWQRPNLLLLDEPTNHFDMDMRAALEIALQSYEGAMLLISHDRHMLSAVSDEFYLVYDYAVKAFDGELEDYYQFIQNANRAERRQEAKITKTSSDKQKKAAQNRIKKLEQHIESQQKTLSEIEHALADERLYQADQKSELQTLIEKQKAIREAIATLEEEWFGLQESLEG